MILIADAPADLAPAEDIYGPLVGSWDVRVLDYAENKPHEYRGEWHFYRVLEGRAIQDVFIVPSRAQRTPETGRDYNRYGTTIRYYDHAIRAWHITWFNPVRDVESRLTGRKVGDEIVQEGTDANGGLMRWCFRDLKPDSFRWTGEESRDQGKTWKLTAEFFATRAGSERP